LTIDARVMPQPHLMFNHGEKFVIPNNGIYRADNPNSWSNSRMIICSMSMIKRNRMMALICSRA